MEWGKELIKSIMAGVMISMGCVVNIKCDNPYAGALLFCVGLVSILLFDFSLYTGKVCYIPEKDNKYTSTVMLILLGNIIGCVMMGMMLPNQSTSVCIVKLSYDQQEIWIKSVLCGILIYIAVDAYKQHQTLIPTFLCVSVFILSEYIHVVADAFYFANAGVLNADVIEYMIIAAIGNAMGGMFIPFINSTKLMNKRRNDYGKQE